MIGIRGMQGSLAPIEWARDNGVTIFTPDDVVDTGPVAIAEKIRAIVGEGPV